MKSVLISIKPKYCELIGNGSKTIEVRKTRPKIETPFKCYIYCTHSGITAKERDRNIYTDFSGKVIGEFVCDGIYEFHYNKGGYLVKGDISTTINALAQSRLTDVEFREYAREQSVYGWHISDLKIYDKPKELHNFHNCSRCKIKYDCDVADWNCYEPLKRPPQSWCYVEGATNNE